jgi:hypothetical protein
MYRDWGLRFHDPKVSLLIEPAGSLLDYLDTVHSFTIGSDAFS